MASETTFDHWKVVFSWGKMRKSQFSQNPLTSRFWAFGFSIYTSSSANFKKDPPWNIFFLSLHAPATSAITISDFQKQFYWVSLHCSYFFLISLEYLYYSYFFTQMRNLIFQHDRTEYYYQAYLPLISFFCESPILHIVDLSITGCLHSIIW